MSEHDDMHKNNGYAASNAAEIAARFDVGTAMDTERAAFEAAMFASDGSVDLSRDETGEYERCRVQDMWRGWRLGRAALRKEIASDMPQGARTEITDTQMLDWIEREEPTITRSFDGSLIVEYCTDEHTIKAHGKTVRDALAKAMGVK